MTVQQKKKRNESKFVETMLILQDLKEQTEAQGRLIRRKTKNMWSECWRILNEMNERTEWMLANPYKI